jgi:hypothetical protein
MPERNATIFEVLIGQVAENGHVNVVLDKPLRVLAHAEFFEPICNLLHGGPPTVSSWHDRVFDHRNHESIPFYPRYHASDGNFRHRFPSISEFNWDFRFDSMGQHNAILMLSTLWRGQLTRLSGRRHSGQQNRDCRTARSTRKTCPSHFDALRAVYSHPAHVLVGVFADQQPKPFGAFLRPNGDIAGTG